MNNYIIELYDDGIDELSYMIPKGFEESIQGLSEAEANRKYDKLKLEILDIEKFVKMNECKVITNPIFFASVGSPTPDGLLSNEIFGLTKDERSGIFAYLDLKEKFIQPYFYKIWLKLDKNLRSCVYETKNFIIDKNIS